jgi:hypothetical protein
MMNKQDGRKKSQNLQFHNCKNVKIEKIVNNNENRNKNNQPAKQFKSKRGSELKMLKISFNKSNSKNFEQAVVLANKVGGIYDGLRCVILMPDSQILEHLNTLKILNSLVQNWKSLLVVFRGREVNFYKFLHSMTRIKECSIDFTDEKHCQVNIQKEGWGCKFISTPKYHIAPYQKKITNSSYWYNFGHFSAENEWTIDKGVLKHIITNYVKKRGLDLCPNFSFKTVFERIENLPEKIIVDGINFEHSYALSIENNKVSEKPDNIRHIQKKEKQSEPGQFNQEFRMVLSPENGYRFSDN